VIIHDLDVVCSVLLPGETDTPLIRKLILDANAVLALAGSLERLEPIAWRNANVLKPSGRLQLIQLSECDGLRCAPGVAPPGEEEAVGVLAAEGLNHGFSI
jgi:hypothetical protein